MSHVAQPFALILIDESWSGSLFMILIESFMVCKGRLQRRPAPLARAHLSRKNGDVLEERVVGGWNPLVDSRSWKVRPLALRELVLAWGPLINTNINTNINIKTNTN